MPMRPDSAPDGLTRRRFVARCAGCALAAACGLSAEGRPARARAPRPPATPRGGRPKVRVIFSHIPAGQPTWPFISYDYEARKRDLFGALEAGCPGVAFLPATAHNAEQARALLAGDRDVDGYLVYAVGIWTGALAAVAASGKPTLFVDDLYAGSGEFLTAYAAAQRAGLANVAGVSSSRFDDVLTAAQCFARLNRPGAAPTFAAECRAAVRGTYAPQGDVTPAPGDAPPPADPAACAARLRESTILVVGPPMQPIGSAIEEAVGTRVIPIDYGPLDAAYKAADPDEARAIADRWIRAADAVVEPTADEVRKSAAMYLGMKALMQRHGARAIAINCLGGFYGGHLAAYPCLGFCQLNDDGLVGACEADLRSTLTMLAMSDLVGRPGYISDPVIDTATHRIIYAHCVAPRKVNGPQGPTNPYQIRSHSEDRKGASVHSLLPLGRLTTTLQFDPVARRILLHQAKAVANVEEDKACRTKLAGEVKGDIDRLMRQWDRWGWHRVTFYGDLREPVARLAERIGFPLEEEA